jgi:hypothetical protein
MNDPDGPAIAVNLQRFAAPDWSLRAVPLRYGDHYEFAAGVVDRAGGQASELTAPGEPWRLDVSRMATMDPPQKERVHFLRRVPVGSCNIVPKRDFDSTTEKIDWPETPAKVWMRCLEAHGESKQGERPTAILLVPDTSSFGTGDDETRDSRWVDNIDFRIEPPSIDEHTLKRWSMPATDLGTDASKNAVDQLKEKLRDIHHRRNVARRSDTYGNERPLPHDPAVAAIGVRWSENGAAVHAATLDASVHPISIATGAITAFDPASLGGTVAPGEYIRLSFLVLVPVEDYVRFDDDALAHLVEVDEWLDAVTHRRYRAFKESVIYFESASAALPILDIDHLSLRSDAAGNVHVHYDFTKLDQYAPALIANVHQSRISSRRWVWRNLPIPPADPSTLDEESDEWRRRLCSGPPRGIFGADPDNDAELVNHYDVISAIDTGFIGREDVVERFPRQRDKDTTLLVDGREAITGADYLHYKCAVRSRYQGVMKEPESAAVGPRRIAPGFRGDASKIKPPRILAVLPMTLAMPNNPHIAKPGDAAPFLVIVDELWHREYGIGERLQARVAHVKAEIEDSVEPPELRFGPLPDHSVTPLTDIDATKALDVFGPFGFSLDRSGTQARANATGFVVYPPRGTPAHFNVFLEFVRQLDLPSGADSGAGRAPLTSARTEAVPVYTLADADELVDKLLITGEKTLSLKQASASAFTYRPETLSLVPFRGAAGEVLTQYRYLMIVGRMVRDGGRAVDVFFPEQAMWLGDGKARRLGNDQDRSWTAAVVCEVLLNGRYAFGTGSAADDAHPLSEADSLRGLFRLMFPQRSAAGKEESDAPGMFRRVSKPFKLSVMP